MREGMSHRVIVDLIVLLALMAMPTVSQTDWKSFSCANFQLKISLEKSFCFIAQSYCSKKGATMFTLPSSTSDIRAELQGCNFTSDIDGSQFCITVLSSNETYVLRDVRSDPKVELVRANEMALALCVIQTGCGPPPEDSYATHSLSAGSSVNSVATYTCKPGFKYAGTKQQQTSTCLPNGQWTQIPTCAKIECEYPPTIQNGACSAVEPFPINKTVFYNCRHGYTLSPYSTTCQEDGTWSLPIPACTFNAQPGKTYQCSQNKRLKTPALNIIARSQVDCASRCLKDSKCIAYNFLPQVAKGKGSCMTFQTVTDFDTSAGWLYCERQGDVN